MGVLDALFGADALRRFRCGRRAWSARRAAVVLPEEAHPAERARIGGRALPQGAGVRAPFTGLEVIGWKTSADQKRMQSLDDGYRTDPGGSEALTWVRELDDAWLAPFFVVGETGARVLVDVPPPPPGVTAAAPGPPAPWLLLLAESDVTGAPAFQGADPPPALDQYLRRNGYLPSGFMGIDGDHRFREACLRSGDAVTVFGRVEETSLVALGGYRDAPERILRVFGTENEPLVILPA